MPYDEVPKDAVVPQIAFLLYASRSGSTFLAASLAETRHVGVTIESTFVGRLIEVERSIRSDGDVDAIMRLLASDRTYGDWNFDPSRLRAVLAALPRPAGVEAITRALLRMWCDGGKPDDIGVKGWPLYPTDAADAE